MKKKENIIKVRPIRDFANLDAGKTYYGVELANGFIKVLNNINIWAWYHTGDFKKEGEDNVNTIQK